ncbi:MAG TPA: hypothetical protein DEA08_12790 [Planctomycetes bacterium]|nr:hypothetical protein [Planctomycetota bacterium]
MEPVRVKRVDQERDAGVLERIAALEAAAVYPLGDDFFQIDHGPDYFAFFDRLGDLVYYAAFAGDRVAAVAAGILRQVPCAPGRRPRPAWYLCDLKVHPDFRRQRIPLKMLRASFLPNVLRCRRGYAITMNPAEGENPVVRLASHWRWTPIHFAATLQLYSCDADQMRALEPLVREHRGPVGYLSLSGVKDIVLQSTGEPLPLLHLVHGPEVARQTHTEPLPGATHMFCTPAGDPLDRAVQAAGHEPGSSASVIQHGMGRCDWRFVLTSEI